jgi:carboxypeptidase C (cathepsin A)
MIGLYANKLNWRTDRRYYMLSTEANRSWQWGNQTTPPESVSDLKAALALDPHLRVLIVHGFTDLVTPYMGSVLALDQLPAYGDASRTAVKVYPGGHMVYARDASRAALHEDVRDLLVRIQAAPQN